MTRHKKNKAARASAASGNRAQHAPSRPPANQGLGQHNGPGALRPIQRSSATQAQGQGQGNWRAPLRRPPQQGWPPLFPPPFQGQQHGLLPVFARQHPPPPPALHGQYPPHQQFPQPQVCPQQRPPPHQGQRLRPQGLHYTPLPPPVLPSLQGLRPHNTSRPNRNVQPSWPQCANASNLPQPQVSNAPPISFQALRNEFYIRENEAVKKMVDGLDPYSRGAFTTQNSHSRNNPMEETSLQGDPTDPKRNYQWGSTLKRLSKPELETWKKAKDATAPSVGLATAPSTGDADDEEEAVDEAQSLGIAGDRANFYSERWPPLPKSTMIKEIESLEDVQPGKSGWGCHEGLNGEPKEHWVQISDINWWEPVPMLKCNLIASLKGRGLQDHNRYKNAEHFMGGLWHEERDGSNDSEIHGEIPPAVYRGPDGIDVGNMMHKNATMQYWPAITMPITGLLGLGTEFTPIHTELTQKIHRKMEAEGISGKIEVAAQQCPKKQWDDWFKEDFDRRDATDLNPVDGVAFKGVLQNAGLSSHPASAQWTNGPHAFPPGFYKYYDPVAGLLRDVRDPGMEDFLAEHMKYPAGVLEICRKVAQFASKNGQWRRDVGLARMSNVFNLKKMLTSSVTKEELEVGKEFSALLARMPFRTPTASKVDETRKVKPQVSTGITGVAEELSLAGTESNAPRMEQTRKEGVSINTPSKGTAAALGSVGQIITAVSLEEQAMSKPSSELSGLAAEDTADKGDHVQSGPSDPTTRLASIEPAESTKEGHSGTYNGENDDPLPLVEVQQKDLDKMANLPFDKTKESGCSAEGDEENVGPERHEENIGRKRKASRSRSRSPARHAPCPEDHAERDESTRSNPSKSYVTAPTAKKVRR